MKKLNNTICNIINFIYLTKFYLSNKDVGSLKKLTNKFRGKNYILNILPLTGTYEPSSSSLTTSVLVSISNYTGLIFLFWS